MEELNKWMEHGGVSVLNDKGIGFFIYDDNGWINIVEVYYCKTTKKLHARKHKLTPQSVAKIAKTKKTSRRIAFEKNSGITEKLIIALGKMLKKDFKEIVLSPETEVAKEKAADSQVEEWLKKHSRL